MAQPIGTAPTATRQSLSHPIPILTTPVNVSSDEALLCRLQQREERAFRQLYDQYGPVLYGVILNMVRDRELAQDLLQDSFLKIWRYIDKYDADRGSFFTWLLNVARHTAIDALRASRPARAVRLTVALPARR
jgi:DNA-directed RNA polymerase specialized sigma24 family protein